MFVVALARGGYFDFADPLPSGVIAVESPALGVRDHLDRMNDGHRASGGT